MARREGDRQGHRRQARRHRASARARAPLYDQKKFDTPYIRDFLLDRGAAGGRLGDRGAVVQAAAALRQRDRGRRARSYAELGVDGLDHVPPVALVPLGRLPLLHLRVPARRGRPARPVRPAQVRDPAGRSSTPAAPCRTTTPSAPSTRRGWSRTSRRRASHMIDGLFAAIDPGQNFNPGKIVVKIGPRSGTAAHRGPGCYRLSRIATERRIWFGVSSADRSRRSGFGDRTA